MKKLFALMLLCTAISFCLLSCSNDDDSISGTTWKEIDGTATKTFRFDNSTCTYAISFTTSSVKATLAYNYTLSYPKVYLDAQTTGYADLEGTISGNSMVVVNTSKGTTVGTFTKQ